MAPRADGFYVEVGSEELVVRLRDFYRDVVGLELDHDEEGHSTWFVGNIGFHESEETLANPAAVNIRLLVDSVAEVDGEAARLQAAGVELLMAPTEMPWRQYTMLFADPAGHLVWLGANL